MYKLRPIGKVMLQDDKTIIQIKKEFRKALKHVDKFSHIHVFFIINKCGKSVMRKEILNIQEMNFNKGFIISSTSFDINIDAELIDIKPYFPSEDRVNPVAINSANRGVVNSSNKIAVHKAEDWKEGYPQYDINSIGQIRNVHGDIYIQLDYLVSINSSYITIYWWFHKFDSDMYRGITQADPPYENAPKSGIFATRSPVRPNPIAITIAHVLRVDSNKKRIYINGIESFDKTPCIGINEYNFSNDYIKNCVVPDWLKHWPEHLDDTVQKAQSDDIKIIDSNLCSLLMKLDKCGNIEQDIQKLQEEKTELKYEKPDNTDVNNSELETKRLRNLSEIHVFGARENNLKGINIRVPYRKITAVVGVSGSGKSSLVSDTIYAECRRRMEYLGSSHNILAKPKVDEITGCIPAVVITQDAIRGNSLSTVGTYSDAYDYLRSIYASVAIRHCPKCGHEIIALTKERIIALLKAQKDVKIFDLSHKLGEKAEISDSGSLLVATEKDSLKVEYEKCNVESVLKKDCLETRTENINIEALVETALYLGKGAFYAELDNNLVLLQTKQKCYNCDTLMFELTPTTFSYMDADSRCTNCNGTGKAVIIDEKKVIDHPELSLLEGASSFYGKLKSFINNPNANWMKGQVFGLAKAMNVNLELPWVDLPNSFRDALLHGSEQEVTFTYNNKKNGRKGEIRRQVEGIYQIIERIYEDNSNLSQLDKYMSKVNCNACNGERLGREGRIATINNIRYPEAAKMTFYELREFCLSLKSYLNETDYKKIGNTLYSLKEVANAAIKLGIGYLQLNQETNSLSAGEGQRLKLLGAFKNHMSGILYIFDEPSKGLHPKDYIKIQGLLKDLVEEGNTIIIVEHNEDMIRIADNIIEIGPGAGEKGGLLVGEGTLKAMVCHRNTQICRYMNREEHLISSHTNRTSHQYKYISMQQLSFNNLKNIDIKFPMQALTCICGISGSGKSSLVRGEIFLRAKTNKQFSEVVMVDQLPIGKTSKSIVATYIGIMDFIRREFAAIHLSKERGWNEAYFSFNSQFGQCDTCTGEGRNKVKYLEETYVQCPDCKGRRYKNTILEVYYRGKNIDEILCMSVDEALQFWDKEQKEVIGLLSLQKVGLGYLKLGQGTSTLSGGEAARLKLASELITKNSSNILYLLDEPTNGLHFSDIDNLLKLINELISNGNTIIAIEHNKQFMSHCDWKIELGPGAGKHGGYVISQGFSGK